MILILRFSLNDCEEIGKWSLFKTCHLGDRISLHGETIWFMKIVSYEIIAYKGMRIAHLCNIHVCYLNSFRRKLFCKLSWLSSQVLKTPLDMDIDNMRVATRLVSCEPRLQFWIPIVSGRGDVESGSHVKAGSGMQKNKNLVNGWRE